MKTQPLLLLLQHFLYSPFLLPNLLCSFIDPLSPFGAASLFMGIRPFTAAWATTLPGTVSLKKTDCPSTSRHQLPVAHQIGTDSTSPSAAHAGFSCLDYVQVLRSQPQCNEFMCNSAAISGTYRFEAVFSKLVLTFFSFVLSPEIIPASQEEMNSYPHWKGRVTNHSDWT